MEENKSASQRTSKIGLFWTGFIIYFAFAFFLSGFVNVFGAIFGIFGFLGGFGTMVGGIIYELLAIAVLALIIYFIFRKSRGAKYVFLGFFTGLGLVILWAGSCFGIMMIGGGSYNTLGLAMIASIAIPVIVLALIVRKIKSSLSEQDSQTNL